MHNQKRHGWRYGGGTETARRSMRGLKDPKERAEYRKRAGMGEAKKVEKPKTQDDGYGEGVKTIRNDNPKPPPNSFVPSENPAIRIIPRQVTEGSEKQIDWANSIKTQEMNRIIDIARNNIRNVERITGNKPAQSNVAMVISLRNKILSAMNGESSAKTIIDKWRGARIESIMTLYDINP